MSVYLGRRPPNANGGGGVCGFCVGIIIIMIIVIVIIMIRDENAV